MTILGDLDGDGCVTIGDFLTFSKNFAMEVSGGSEDGDFDGDGTVNIRDFLTFSRNFGECSQAIVRCTAGATHGMVYDPEFFQEFQATIGMSQVFHSPGQDFSNTFPVQLNTDFGIGGFLAINGYEFAEGTPTQNEDGTFTVRLVNVDEPVENDLGSYDTVVADHLESVSVGTDFRGFFSYYMQPGDFAIDAEGDLVSPDNSIPACFAFGRVLTEAECRTQIIRQTELGTWGPRQPDVNVGGNALGALSLTGSLKLFRESGDDDFDLGLAQEWLRSGNPGNLSRLEVDRLEAGVEPIAFRSEDGTTWWYGDSPGFGELPSYPSFVEEAGFEAGAFANNDEYSVVLSGEILFEEAGVYRFRDGVDDYAYLAIDIDGSGVAGDRADEVLIDDNRWTGINGVRGDRAGNSPSPTAELVIADADGTGWHAIRFVVAEGGGGDGATLFWNGLDLENDRLSEEGSILLPDDLVPDSHLRSQLPGEIFEARLIASLESNTVYEMQVSSDLVDSDRIVVDIRESDLVTTVLDVGDSTVRILEVDKMVPGDSFVLFSADQIVGLDSLTMVFDRPTLWDTSRLGTHGGITFRGATSAPVPEPGNMVNGLVGWILMCGLLNRSPRSRRRSSCRVGRSCR